VIFGEKVVVLAAVAVVRTSDGGGTHVLVREEGGDGGGGGVGDKGKRWRRYACADVLGVGLVWGRARVRVAARRSTTFWRLGSAA